MLSLFVISLLQPAIAQPRSDAATAPVGILQPAVITTRVEGDSDDPAVWVDPTHPENSLLLGTDKKHGSLCVFGLDGVERRERRIDGLSRPNNVDVEYGLKLGERRVDIAVVTERDAGRVRIFELPSLKPLDGGGIDVFVGEPNRAVMGVGLYKRPHDGEVFAIVSRKEGESGSLLFQYRVAARTDATVALEHVRAFGRWAGPRDPNDPSEGNEVESIVVDDELGYVYYSEEKVGVHKYYADPQQPNVDVSQELALFATTGFAEDREGLSIHSAGASAGFLLVSDQGANRFHVFSRTGSTSAPHQHDRLAVIDVSATESDGSETISLPLGPNFPRGLFVAMSDDRTFHVYDWRKVIARIPL